jgi:trans-aconitate 2-methyltransferase
MGAEGGDWNPELYLAYEDERTQPARDLLAAVPLEEPALIFDLGCGPGNSTEVLCRRYGSASVRGLDSSPAMIEAARRRVPGAQFELADIAHWQPGAPVNLLYANASLQWVGAHETLFPALLSYLSPGGVLAVQMPDNRDEPMHRLMDETAKDSPWWARIAASAQARTQTLPLDDYYDLLSPLGAKIRMWRTTYIHVLESAGAIADWLLSTGLRPFLAPLSDDEQRVFLADYTHRLEVSYSARSGGKVLLRFPRKFLVVQKPI